MKIHEPEVVGDLTSDEPITADVETQNVTATERLVIPTDEPTTLIDGAIWLA
jgi:hypothetical protein